MPAIAKRKQKPPKPAIDPTTTTSLVTLYGQVDALHWPFRAGAGLGQDREALAAVHELRTDYLKFGFHFKIASDGSAAGWKQAQYQREALAATGHVTLETHQRKPRLKFTPEGDAYLRDLLHLTSLGEVGLILKALIAFQKFDHALDGVWVSESHLFGGPDYTTENEWNAVSESMLPLIVAGVVEAKCSTIQQIWYRPLITKTRANTLIKKWKARPTQRVGKKPNAKLLGPYFRSFKAFRKQLATMKPTDPSNIQIPLRATL